MSPHCMSFWVFLCAFTAYFTPCLHTSQVCLASEYFTQMAMRFLSPPCSLTIWLKCCGSDALSSALSLHFSCCAVSIAWMLPGLFSQSPVDKHFVCFQTKLPIHSYPLPWARKQVQVLRRGFLYQGEEKY